MGDVVAAGSESWASAGITDDLAATLQAAGYSGPTALQSVLLPAIASEGHVVCEAPSGTGRTLAIAASVAELVQDCEPGHDPVAVVVTSTEHRCGPIARAIATCGASVRRSSESGIRLGILSDLATAEGQAALLARPLDVVIGTPNRLAALLESGTLASESVEMLVIDQADDIAIGTAHDALESLLDSLAPDRQRVVLAGALLSPLLDLIADRLPNPQRPAPPLTEPLVGLNVEQLAFSVVNPGPDAAMRALSMMGATRPAVLVHPSKAEEFRGYFATRSISCDVISNVGDLKPDSISHLFVIALPTGTAQYAAVLTATAGAGAEAIVLLAAPAHRHLLRSFGRVGSVQFNAAPLPDEAGVEAMRTDRVEQLVREQLTRVSAQPTPRFLQSVHQLAAEFDVADVAAAAMDLAHRALQREVKPGADLPMLLASPAAAPAGNSDRRVQPSAAPTDPNRRRGAERRQREVEPGMIRLFVAAGYNYGVRPGDIVGAFAGESGLSGKEIGNIDIRETFTLVEVPEESAEEVIAAMADGTIKGRSIEVRRERY